MEIIVNQLAKSYGPQEIFGGLEFHLENVSSVGIIGPSGCGKSTLLRLLSGLESPDSGEITIDGLSPQKDQKSFQKNIGYVFQTHNLFPHLTVARNITLILEKRYGMTKAEAKERAKSVLCQLHLNQEAHKKPGQISGGQAQRGSIARALATDPKLLFLDEPTASLDPVLTREVLEAVQDLKTQGREFLFVTHEMDFLQSFADYILFMDQGTLVEHGPVEIFDHPQTPELQQFLSTAL